jgi:predicted regulator of Ras-like GTPase activity (Roadblock/LC7/MglB family)
MTSGAALIQRVLDGLLERDEVLGIVATTRDGLVLGSAGIPDDQAVLVAALGAPLAGVAAQVIGRLGGEMAKSLSVNSPSGMVHVAGTPDLALVVLTDRCDLGPLASACDDAIGELSAIFSLT